MGRVIELADGRVVTCYNKTSSSVFFETWLAIYFADELHLTCFPATVVLQNQNTYTNVICMKNYAVEIRRIPLDLISLAPTANEARVLFTKYVLEGLGYTY